MNKGFSFLFTALLLVAGSVFSASPALDGITLEPLDPEKGKPVNLGEVKSPYIVLHFLTEITTRDDDDYVNEFMERAPEIAGVSHFFIRAGEEAAAKSFTKHLKDPDAVLYHNRLGSIAKKFGVTQELRIEGKRVFDQTIIVIEPGLGEIFRMRGKRLGQHPSFDQFLAVFTEKTLPQGFHHYNLGKKQLAAKGYDVVSYQDGYEPRKGSSTIKSHYGGGVYHFNNAKNRDTFNENPAKYAPAYGGWCATAMADGKKVDISPEYYSVNDGTLYLFTGPTLGLFGSAKKTWDNKAETLKPKADTEWKGLTGQ